MRPSIIFFDEIDGLAPIRSSRQEQSYSSIVSTLLACMDGLDGRGEVVVIGATVMAWALEAHRKVATGWRGRQSTHPLSHPHSPLPRTALMPSILL